MTLLHIFMVVALSVMSCANVVQSSSSDLIPLPTLDQFLQGTPESLAGQFIFNDQCSAMVTNTDTTYLITSSPSDCMNLVNLLTIIVPKDKGNFEMESEDFMNLDNIVIRSLSFNTMSKEVSIAALYVGSVPLVRDVITLSNVYIDITFTSTQSDQWKFYISATLTIGTVNINARIIRNEDGYYMNASSTDSLSATEISNLFQTSNSFLPTNGLESKLTEANLDSFAIQNPRIKAVFTEGYGFLFGGQISILDWGPYDVNLLINEPNDSPTAVTIAIFIPSFSLSKMFNDLFDIDITSLPVFGSAEVRNLALTMSTQEVETPLIPLDIGYQNIFDLPYRQGIKASFDIIILDVTVTVSVLITPTELQLTVSQSSDLTLRKIVNAFFSDETNLISGDPQVGTLNGWPKFITFDPLAISLSYLDIAATNDNGWSMTSFDIRLAMTEPIVLFNQLITISELAFEMRWRSSTDISGLVTGKVVIGTNENASPQVDVEIPFPFANQEIAFTFTDFSIRNVAAALGFTLPTNFFELLAQIQLDRIVLAFDESNLNKISVEASMPQPLPIYGSFSISQLKFVVEIDNMADTNERAWVVTLSGHILVSSCDILISTTIDSDMVQVRSKGTNCVLSVRELLTQISVNPEIVPSQISGITLSEPAFSFTYDRQSGAKSIGFAVTSNLLGVSDAEVAFVNSGSQSAVVAGFAVQSASDLQEISFLGPLGLTDLAVIYISDSITLEPYQWQKPVFQSYVPTDSPAPQGLKILARFTPSTDNLMGKLLSDAGKASIQVELTLPDLIFRLDVSLGDGLPLGDSGAKFVSMAVVISKSLVGLSLSFKLPIDNGYLMFTGALSFTISGSVKIELLMEGTWNEPFGIQNFAIHRLGLALGIQLATLAPSFGLTGAITMTPPGLAPINANVTICIDTAAPLSSVVEIHFTRLLLEDIVNTFAGRSVELPPQVAEMGFYDEVQIYVSPGGNDLCFQKTYEAGVEIHGSFKIPFLQVYARVDISIKIEPSFHLKANLSLNPINYGEGLMKIVSAQSDDVGPYLIMNIGNADEFLINGSCRIVLFGASISILLEITTEKLYFEGRMNLWNLFQVFLKVDLVYTADNPRLHVVGEMQNDLFARIKTRACQGIRTGARVINQKIETAQVKITRAQSEVDRLLAAARYHQTKIDEAKRQCSQAPWWRKWVCIGSGAKIVYHGTLKAAVWVAHGVAQGVLELARLFLEGVQGLIALGAEVLAALVEAALSIIDIQYVRFDMYLSSQRRTFDFTSRVVIFNWTFEPSFSIDFTSSTTAEVGINGAGDTISSNTIAEMEKYYT